MSRRAAHQRRGAGRDSIKRQRPTLQKSPYRHHFKTQSGSQFEAPYREGIPSRRISAAKRGSLRSGSKSGSELSHGRILMATWRPSVVSVVRYTCPIPPSPVDAVMS